MTPQNPLWLCFMLVVTGLVYTCSPKAEEIKAGDTATTTASKQQRDATPLVLNAGERGELPEGIPVPAKWIDPNSVPPPVVVHLEKGEQLPFPGKERFYVETRSVPVASVLPTLSPGEHGVPLPEKKKINGRVVLPRQPEPIPALAPVLRPNAIADIQVVDVLQGLSSSFVEDIIEDRQGHLWIATGGGGVSRYDGHSFVHYSREEGLQHSSVHVLMEDSRGNIWIGTDGGGLTKYDGYYFTHFTEEEGMTSNVFEALLEDSQGYLWFGTRNNGLSKYTPAHLGDESFLHYTTENGIPHGYVSALVEDRHGDLWIGTLGGGVARFDGQQFVYYTTEEGLIHNRVHCMKEDSRGDMWFGTQGGGACRFDGHRFYYYTTAEGLTNNFVRDIHEDDDGNIWIATEGGGVNIYNRAQNFITHLTKDEGLSSNEAIPLLEDSDGNVWIGTSGQGICRFRSASFRHSRLGHAPLTEDGLGNLLTYFDGRLRKFDYKKGTYREYTYEKGELGEKASAILKDSRGNVWIGVPGVGLVKYYGETLTIYTREQGIIDGAIISITEDRKGNIWTLTHNRGLNILNDSGLYQFSLAEGLISTGAYAVKADSRGNIWIGFYNSNGGLSKYDLLGNHTHFTTDNGLSTNVITFIEEDSRGNLLIGTWNGGVNIFDGERFTVIDEKAGLTDNIVWSIAEDHLGRYWVSTEQGLDLLIPTPADPLSGAGRKAGNFQIINFGRNDGLNSLSIDRGFLDRSNKMWWADGSILDLTAFELSAKAPRIKLDHIELEQVYVDYRRLTNTTYLNTLPFANHLDQAFDSVAAFQNYPVNLSLPHQIDHLTFHFSAIDWVAPHRIRYQFMMEGLEEGWNPATTDNKADYRSLPHGTFTFKVRAAGQSMRWSEPFAYTFTILPPWWLTWWAKALYGVIGLVLTWAVIRSRTAALRKRQKVLEQTVREKTAEVVEQKERAERSEKIKEQFLANMSHEIRTPMNAILGMIRILRRNDLLPAQRLYLDAIHQSADNLLVILNDILDLSKIEAGKIEIASVPMNPVKVVENVLDILQFKAEEKGLSLSYRTEGNIPELVMGDPARLNQILLNLIGNAIKFTDKGTIRALISRNGEAGMLRFAVEDQGIGIPADKLKTIFNSFEQVSTSSTRKYGGTGLGLTITKQLVELQKGKIWIESEENKGSTFFFELPVTLAAGKQVTKAAATEEQLKAMGHDLAGMKILLAEDNPFNTMLAQDDLSYYIPGVAVDVAGNGLAALENYQANTYDLILMDVHMPEMNGYEASRRIREMEAERQIRTPVPIVAMTASLLTSEVALCYEAGMDHYVPKPYKIEELIGTIFSMANKVRSL